MHDYKANYVLFKSWTIYGGAEPYMEKLPNMVKHKGGAQNHANEACPK